MAERWAGAHRCGHAERARHLKFPRFDHGRCLAAALVQWRDDPAVAMVYLRGAGDRAFCAGGDIQALYRSCKANREAGRRVDSYAEDFFEREYRLDYVLHTFPKPVLCYGHGVVMGGGLGLLAASRFRVVTPKSRVAMPEITIGLFPDAGGTTLLSAMPGSLGLFLGLTGTHFRGGDARALGLGTHLIADDAGPALEAALRGMTLPQGNDGEAAMALGKALASRRLMHLRLFLMSRRVLMGPWERPGGISPPPLRGCAAWPGSRMPSARASPPSKRGVP